MVRQLVWILPVHADYYNNAGFAKNLGVDFIPKWSRSFELKDAITQQDEWIASAM